MKFENLSIRKQVGFGNNNFQLQFHIYISNESKSEVLSLLGLCLDNDYKYSGGKIFLSITEYFYSIHFTQTDLQEFLLNKDNKTWLLMVANKNRAYSFLCELFLKFYEFD